MKIILAHNIGFCFGVERAYQMSLQALMEGPCYMLGKLVHNENILEDLRSRGLQFIESPEEATQGTVIIRAHGIDDKTRFKLEEKKVKVVDATCPLVKKAQDLARDLEEEGYRVAIIGKKDHAEVRAIKGVLRNRAFILEEEKDISEIPRDLPLGVVVQTTQNKERAGKIIEKIKSEFKKVKINNTLCYAVGKRQEEVKSLLKEVDIILVVGSEISANTTELCKIAGEKAYLVGGPTEVRKGWFSGKKSVGVISGTSVSLETVEAVVKKIEEINRQ